MAHEQSTPIPSAGHQIPTFLAATTEEVLIFARTVRMELKPNSVAEFTQLLEDEACVPSLTVRVRLKSGANRTDFPSRGKTLTSNLLLV